MFTELVFVVRYLSGLERIHQVQAAELTIGRLPDNALCLPDLAVSRHHAVVSRNATEIRIRDLNSRNGTC